MKNFRVRALTINNDLVEGFIYFDSGYFIKNGQGTFGVDYDTICRCTGLNDCNGKVIFEGDILYSKDDNEFIVPRWNYTSARFSLVRLGISPSNKKYNLSKTEIVGNIFEKTLPTIILNGRM